MKKHVPVHYHFLEDKVETRCIKLLHVRTLGDALTTPIGKKNIRGHRDNVVLTYNYAEVSWGVGTLHEDRRETDPEFHYLPLLVPREGGGSVLIRLPLWLHGVVWFYCLSCYLPTTFGLSVPPLLPLSVNLLRELYNTAF